MTAPAVAGAGAGPRARTVGLLAGVALAPVLVPLAFLILFIAAVAAGAGGHDQGQTATAPGAYTGQIADGQVPATFAPWLTAAAAACRNPELTPVLLAAQVRAESNFNTSRTLVSPAGAMGSAQFMPSAWATWGRDDDHNGRADPYDVGDAVMSQGRYMCALIGKAKASGILGDVRALALAGYNAGWGRVQAAHGIPAIPETRAYVAKILTWAQQMTLSPDQIPATGIGAAIVNAALAEQGLPYVWGGGGVHGPTAGGFDCSGLTQYAVYAATHGRITLPRTSQQQRTAGVPIPRAQMQPGDLIVINNDGNWGHVGIYAGSGRMVNAPKPGRPIDVEELAGYWAKFPWDIRRVA
ncbi:Cell wall-associated hydrolase, NlpC family [Actinacidiphila rubida]|uniref:Cell wall-associated hydrolase, NlpC family n=1 Tax=Actinacidiphila rubida TaxID=310780 RepID=A0A1H8TFB0_9ACTN|nr:bifunctional lytic transglycosylase/C40 family peptidase [Actinacidiphila rubida]SEO89561.1 Cell wall-associated hydrolase, NlpC family [Actinacidiphila rubida]